MRNLEKIINEALELFRGVIKENPENIAVLEEGFSTWIENILLGQAQPHGRFSSYCIAKQSEEFRSTLRGMYSDPEWEDGVVNKEICATLAAMTTFDAERETAEDEAQWDYEMKVTEEWQRRQY
tara:strand:- start:1973 stop:2344 length:372 start_codon:yes stop_codon:yes gene_type:complete